MSDPEPDAAFRERLLRVVSEELRPFVGKATGPKLDSTGRQYEPLKGLEAAGGRPTSKLPEDLWKKR
jgi:hypothetical protein